MFLLADRPYLFPGRCLLGETRGPCVDTGVEMELGGHVYLNRVEAWEAGRLFGFVEGETYAQACKERDDAFETLVVLEAELAEARQLVESLRVAIRLAPKPRQKAEAA